MSRSNAHHRVSSLFALGSSKPSDRSKSPSLNVPSGSREPSPGPGSRPRSFLRLSRSSQNLQAQAAESQNDGLGIQKLSLQPGAPGGPGSDAFAKVALDEGLPLPPPIGGALFGELTGSPTHSRSSSANRAPRPQSSSGWSLPRSRAGSNAGDGSIEGKLVKSRRNSHSQAYSILSPAHIGPDYAFIVGPQGTMPYDTTPLIKNKRVAELWDEAGNMFVYITDKSTEPSFKIHSGIIASSAVMTGQPRGPSPAEARIHKRNSSLPVAMSRNSSGQSSKDIPQAPNATLEEDEQGLHLSLHTNIQRGEAGMITTGGLETMLQVRNLFAFLMAQVLVGSPSQPSLFWVFHNISKSLRSYGFSNMDGSSLGEAPDASFLGYVNDLRLDDVRSSREKTLEALVLGEGMKCQTLYYEGYVHAVGKYTELLRLQSPVFSMVSDTTRNRLEKSSMSLDSRLKRIKHLQDFEFPSLFAGVLASSAVTKVIDAKAWKASFLAMRRQVIQYYKGKYGSWPPKAKSKKNDFEEGGVNRIVAREVYQDFCDLYDMLVDRNKLTDRTLDVGGPEETPEDPNIANLRKFMSEFDRSSPPVLPPVPYDLPLIPDIKKIHRSYGELNIRKQVKARAKRVTDDEINMCLMQSYNRESVKATPFLQSFMAFERSCAHGKTFEELSDMRIGQWIFLYVIIQSLPILALDAQDIKWSDGVEYYLCEVPKGTSPWNSDDTTQKMSYYRINGGTGVVSMPSDVVDHGVEGIYFRSHCWQVAAQWNGTSGYGPEQLGEPHPQLIQQQAPAESASSASAAHSAELQLNPHDGSAEASRRTSIGMGLEALPMPPSIIDQEKAVRRISTPDPSKNFDAILGSAGLPPKKKK